MDNNFLVHSTIAKIQGLAPKIPQKIYENYMEGHECVLQFSWSTQVLQKTGANYNWCTILYSLQKLLKFVLQSVKITQVCIGVDLLDDARDFSS